MAPHRTVSRTAVETPALDLQAAILDRLDQLVALQKRTALADRYIDLEEIGHLLGFSLSHVRMRVVCLPGFPAPLTIGHGHRRWLLSQVMGWAKKNQ